MLRFNKLRLSGFKSFVDGAELLIEPGLTGVVGPNGCGKSNLVEALRWVMGESSPKQMRGSEMDDVIFNGTADRPPRNIAEIVLNLDNNDRTAPAQYNDQAELSVSRRIERGSGSTFRINGKEARARDVQILFADAATGARSTAIVSQGRIGAVIAAKPADRRSILEEAAGITGLHSRRHEAELRLRGAETNLGRLDDVLVTLDAQLHSLKKQARQATRYRNLSDHIRRAEAALFHLRWRAAADEVETGRGRLKEAEARVTELTRRAGAASTRQANAAARLPELRQAEAGAAAELQRLILARDGLDAEEERIAAARKDCELRLQQVAADTGREKALAADAGAAMERLEAERAGIEDATDGEEAARRKAAEALAAATEAVDALEARLTEVTERMAADEARRASLATTITEVKERKKRLAARAAEIAEAHAELERHAVDPAARDASEAAFAAARAELEQTRAGAETAEAARTEAADTAAHAVSALQAAQAAMTGLEAEEHALAGLLETADEETWPPLIDSLAVEPGFEAALAAALGEDLLAPADEPASVYWRTLAPFAKPPSLPEGAQPLSAAVKGPKALTRRLSQIGVVADERQGARLSDRLSQGQRLVSRDGALWRWDGFTMSAGAATGAAARLERRNRLIEVRGQLAAAGAQVTAAGERMTAARTAADEAAAAEKAARQAAHAADAAYAQARDALAEIKERAADHASRLAALTQTAGDIDAELKAAEARAKEAGKALDALPEAGAARGQVDELRAELVQRRSVQAERRSAHDTLVHAAEERRRRLEDIVGEVESWRRRSDDATRQIGQLEDRRRAAAAELDRLSAVPEAIAEKRRGLLTTLDSAEAKRAAAADRLAETETRVAEAERNLRAAEADLAQAREQRVRAEGLVEQAEQACTSIAERIAERLDCAPDQVREMAGLAEDAELPDMEAVERRAERLQRERETMGPVNLRAEQEAGELKEQMETLETEHTDLIKAIEKLRRGINELNREGRERLLASFKEVDRHFRELFVRLFGGGRAHLALTEPEDPLEAGLEIMASPPGKRLQVLSLLSGGEQALTAIALLFAVFLTNPAPIYVLDEVDAPLDDANVDRFCTLLEEMAASGQTNFLIITHHRMTMARMDRLFGVTMAERGVSQLVSVDLRQAEELRATA